MLLLRLHKCIPYYFSPFLVWHQRRLLPSLHLLQVLSALDTGVAYYVRVSARNSLGYGATQSSSPTYQHPYEEPTAPSDVVLGTTSDTMLTVS